MDAIRAENVEVLMRLTTANPWLLALKVRPTVGDPQDFSSFHNSVAAHGLPKFSLGSTPEVLAGQNDKLTAWAALRGALQCDHAVDDESGPDVNRLRARLLPDEGQRRIDLQADALLAIAQGRSSDFRTLLATAPDLVDVQVLDTFRDLSRAEGFYHQVSSFGLRCRLGDTLLELAQRNGQAEMESACRVLRERRQPWLAPASGSATIRVTNSLSGGVLCELQAERRWTIGQLAEAVQRAAPAPKGTCVLLLREGELLQQGASVADLAAEGAELGLAAVFRAAPTGKFYGMYGGQEDDGHAVGDAGGRRGRRLLEKPTRVMLDIQEGGVARLNSTTFPIDRGHCAGASGGRQLIASGVWSLSPAGLLVEMRDGKVASMLRGHWGPAAPAILQESLTFELCDDDILRLMGATVPPSFDAGRGASQLPAGLRLRRDAGQER